jgi:hypothetical protein
MNITRTFNLDLETAQIVENQENASKWLRFLIKRRGATIADLMKAEDRIRVLQGTLDRLRHQEGIEWFEHHEIVKEIHQENDNAKEPLKGLALWSKVVGAEEVKE